MIKRIALAVLIGAAAAIFLSEIAPRYKYYDDNGRRIEEEVYAFDIQSHAAGSHKYKKIRVEGEAPAIFGGVVTLIIYLLNPLKKKQRKVVVADRY